MAVQKLLSQSKHILHRHGDDGGMFRRFSFGIM